MDLDYKLIIMLERIVEWDSCVIAKADDYFFNEPYGIDFENESLWYPTKDERDRKYDMLVRLVPLLKGNVTIED